MLFAAGAANSATTTVSYQVSASADDGYAWSSTEQDTTSAYLMIGDDRTYTTPYYMSAMRFTNIAIPRSAVIIDARLKISSIDQEYRGQIYGVIQAESTDDAADFSSRYIADANKTITGIDWDHKDAWATNTYYTSPDISTAVQEIINRPGWNSGNSLAIFYSTRADSGKSRMFGSFVLTPVSAPTLEITCEVYTISGYVSDLNTVPLEGVIVSSDNGGGSSTTDPNGYYALPVAPGWSGTVTPSLEGWGFDPIQRTYNNVITDQTNQDYITHVLQTFIVRADGTGDYPTIQAAIDVALNGDTIVVEDGMYTGGGNKNIDFKGSSITVRSVNGPRKTVIDCENSGRALYFHSGESADSVLDGFSLVNGRQTYGGGIYCYQADPTINDCIFENNRASTGTSTAFGGGVYCKESSLTINNCIFRNNSAWANYQNGSGGGIACFNSNATLNSCFFVGNSAYAGTHFGYGGGVYGAGTTLTNCTFVENLASHDGGGVHGGSNIVTNCIFWNNTDSGGSDASAQIYGGVTVSYSCIMGWISGGTGNISGDPNFVSVDDYHLMPSSACIDSGTNEPTGGLTETDLDGNPRAFDGDNDANIVADMGAYEYNTQVPCIAVSPSPTEIYGGKDGPNPESKILSIVNCGGGTLNWAITYECGWLEVTPAVGTSTDEVSEVYLDVNVIGLEEGDYICELTISDPCAVNNPRKVDVILHVVYPVISVTPSELEFQADVDGSNPPAQIISIINEAAGRLNWTITEDCPWLAVDPNSGESTGEIDEVTVSVDITGLPWGDYDCNLTISDPRATNNPHTVQVSLALIGTVGVPDDFPTVQAAIDATREGDTIIVSPGIYHEMIDFKNKAITLTSFNPDDLSVVNSTILDAEEYGQTVTVGSRGILTGFTVTGGRGGISCSGDSLVSNCVVKDNRIGVGCSGNATIYNCTIRNNFTAYNGRGGGVFCGSGSPIFELCVIRNNTAQNSGGAICCYGGDAAAIFNRCIIRDNSAGQWGGAVYCYQTYNGGPTFNNCIISGNSAGLDTGGAFHGYLEGDLTANNCTIVNNSPGGICTQSSTTITINNCIVWDNGSTETDGGTIAKYCDIKGGYPGEGNFDKDPCFADAANGDYHLQSQASRWDPSMNSWITDANTSSCIDAGDPNSDWTEELWPHGKRINMGAYGGAPQASMSLSTAGNKADLDGDGDVDGDDLALLVGMWLVEDVLLSEDINRNGLVNFSDWDVFAEQWRWEE